MGLTSIFTGQAARSPLADIWGLQPADVAQLATIAWQWLVLSAVVAWIGALIAGYRLLTTFRGQQQSSDITAVLHMAAQRQRRQNWLWLSIILVGVAALFWLRLPSVLPHQQLDQAPDWSALWLFILHAPEGWLWLARGGLALLTLGLLAAAALAAHQRARRERRPNRLTRNQLIRRRFQRSSIQQMTENASLIPGRRYPADSSATYLTTQVAVLEQRLLAERRDTQIRLVVLAALLGALSLPLPDALGAQLPLTGLALNGVVLLALAAWLGSILYLPAILVPATHIIESAERTQTLVEVFPAIRPPITPALMAIGLYSLFSVESRLTSAKSLLSTPYGWLLVAELTLLGGILLLTLYQARRALPTLTQGAWLAARGTIMSVLGGMDVSRSLEMSQHERQTLANEAEQRVMSIAYAQVILGMLVLLCLVLASAFAGSQFS